MRPASSEIARLTWIVGALLWGACGGEVIDPRPPAAPPPPPPIVPPPAVPPLAEVPTVAFVDITVVSMDQPGQRAGQTVVTENGLISAVGPSGSVSVPGGAMVIDGSGRFLMPGLADMHTHVATETSFDAGPGQLVLYLANGVTTILNQGDFGAPLPTWAADVRTGALPGPTVYSARYARDTRDGNPTNVQVTTPEAAERYVANAKRDGYQFIKVYNWTRPAVFQRLLSEAERQGLAVIGHIPIDVGASATLDSDMVMVGHAGLGSFYNTLFNSVINPGNIPMATRRVRDSGIWVNPTIAVERAVAAVWGGNAAGEQAVFQQPGVQYAHPATIQRWQTKLFTQRLYNPAGSSPGGRDALVDFIEKYTHDFHSAGVRLLAGSDSPTVLLMAGFSMRNELRALEDLGLSRFEVLESATRNAGDFIAAHVPDAEPFGTIAPGSRADLVLLARDPLADLDHVFDHRLGVMARGAWHSQDDLQALLDQLP